MVELLASSRWWPPEANPLTESVAPTSKAQAGISALNTLLAEVPHARVWMAPYFTYPEPGLLESTARSGVYATFLAVPPSGQLTMNYGASKLTPADTVFSLVSAQGLGAEWRLAQSLDYNRFALDLGAVTDREAATALCRATLHCRISGDAYALFVIPKSGHDASQVGRLPAMVDRLNGLQRRSPLLPYQSAGPSWGPLVFNPFQWRAIGFRSAPVDSTGRRLQLQTQPGQYWQIYRYGLDRYPNRLRAFLDLHGEDVQLVLPQQFSTVEVCIGLNEQRCRPVRLDASRQRIAIGSLLQAGKLNCIFWRSSQASSQDSPQLLLELRLPPAAQRLLVTR